MPGAVVSQPAELKPASPTGETPYTPSRPPTGYTPVPAPTVSVTDGAKVPVNGDVVKLDADFWRVDFDKEGNAAAVSARGNVRAIYREFKVTSGTAQADLRTKVAVFSGNVVLTLVGQDVTGRELSINLDTREWSFDSAHSELRPEVFPRFIQAPIFLSGGSITGSGETEVRVANGGFTTCNLERPHYFVSADSATIWPDRRLIARDATFSALGRSILKLSRIAIPIRQMRDRELLMPRVGQTAEEGVFLKTAYTLLATARNSGNLKLDLMSRKGVGVGIEDNYNLRSGRGNLSAYRLSDRTRNLNTMTGRFTHEHQLGTVKATLSSDYRANSHQYFPGSTSFGNELRLSRSTQTANTNLGIRYALDRGFGRFTRLTSNLQHRQTLSEKSSALLGFDYYRSASPIFSGNGTINAANSQLVSRLDYSREGKQADWNLRISKINDLSDEAFIRQAGSRFAGTERLPELELATSTERLKRRLPFGVPARLGLTLGRYQEDLGRVDTSRAVLEMETPSRIYKLADKLNVTAIGGFRQYVYGNGTAQYSIETSLDMTQRIGQKSSAGFSYRYLRPRGFTPFRFDFSGRYNFLNARLNLQETERFRLSFYGGYNFGQEDFKWQDLTARVTYAPSERYLIFASIGYDLNRSQWRSLVNQMRARLPGEFKLDIGSRYDIERHKFASLKTQLDAPIADKWHIRANAGYNGFTRNFDYRNVQIVRDLHCWELALTYVDQRGFWQERGLRLNLRIKAFPIFDSFGVGQFGQSLDTSVGEVL